MTQLNIKKPIKNIAPLQEANNVLLKGFTRNVSIPESSYSRVISELPRISPETPLTSFTSEKKSLVEKLFDAKASAKILIAAVSMHLDSKWREKIFRQLDLIHDDSDWEIEDVPIQLSSIATFLRSLGVIDYKKFPSLGMSNSGHLLAAWLNGENKLTLEFLPKDRIRWVLSRKSEDETERAAGETLLTVLMSRLSPYNPEQWFLNDNN
jgi:hypothetical protein